MPGGIAEVNSALALLNDALSAKQRLYVEARVRGSPPVVCARMAGFEDPDAAAQQLEDSHLLRQAIELSLRAEVYKTRLTMDDVIDGLLDATRMAANSAELTGAWKEIGRIVEKYAPPSGDKNPKDGGPLKERSSAELARDAALEGEFVVLEDSPAPAGKAQK